MGSYLETLLYKDKVLYLFYKFLCQKFIEVYISRRKLIYMSVYQRNRMVDLHLSIKLM